MSKSRSILGGLTLNGWKSVFIAFLVCATAPTALRAQALTTLHSFNTTDGAQPAAGLVQGADGNFYGTTFGGGANLKGTVFKITPSGALTTLHSFNGPDGSFPSAGLIQATDGNFYGTTQGGGAHGNHGTVFKITPGGALTTLYSFCSVVGIFCQDGDQPFAGLVQWTDGNFYGTTPAGGANGDGTVFKITPDGTLTTLHGFTGGTDGAGPFAGLVPGADLNFYGTTVTGGANGAGTVFLISPGGVLTTLHSFNSTDGARPSAGLIQATDGNFYGTTQQGPLNTGTVFKITPSGTLTTLYTFCPPSNFNGTFCLDGSNPQARLVQATDGNFYGTTPVGGTSNSGTAFKITASGTLTTLLSFNGGDGVTPSGGLIQATDGNFYGTTQGGGANSLGTAFRLVPSAATSTLTLLASSKNPAGAGDSVTFTATVTSTTGGTPTGSVTFLEGVTTLGTQSLSSGQAALTIGAANSLGLGSFSITAQYNPTFVFTASTATIIQTVTGGGVAVTNGGITLTGNQTVTGTVTATSLVGNGSGLTNLNPANLGPGTAGISITGNAATATLALTANNALNLGGLPPSSYQLAGSYALTGPNFFTGDQTITGNLTASGSLSGASGKFTGMLTAGGTSLPAMGRATAGQGFLSSPLDLFASSFNSSSSGAVNQQFRWQAEPTGNSSANPSGTLNLLFASGGVSPAETGLSIDSSGHITFAPGQKFPVSGLGTITGVAAGSGLAGGGTSGNVSLAVDATVARTNMGNTFTGNQAVTGNLNASGSVTAASFFGKGSGLTAVTSTGLNCSGCVGNTQLGIAYAGSAAQGGPATSALLATNALALGGVPPSGYAPATASTVYVAKAGDTMTGDLNLPNLNAGGKVSANGSLVVGNGGTPITEHLSALVNPAFPALHPGACVTADFTLAGAADGDTIALGVPNARMTGGGALSYFAWVSAANTVTVRACNADTHGPQNTPGSGNIRIDLWKH